VLAVYAAARRAVDRARSGGGPTLVEALTYRMKGHAEHDPQAYVRKEDLDAWRKRDPLERYAGVLIESKDATAEQLSAIDDAIGQEADREVQLAEQSPLPAPEVALQNVYANGGVVENEPVIVKRQP
jgi:TPP-dependent pyruvate/acetoin dehydrogenase alpha subunit